MDSEGSEPTNGVTDKELADLFERGIVFADRWPTAVRVSLDVADALSPAVRSALSEGRHVVIAGAAGDGKSHLAMTALDDFNPVLLYEVKRGQPMSSGLSRGTVVLLRDVSALTNDDVLTAVREAKERSLTLLMTINEGPLDTLAPRDETGFLREVREVIHERSRGRERDDPQDTLVINLNGRQLTRGPFVKGAIAKLLKVVRPCRVCGRTRGCPRIVGARELRKSPMAQERLARLLQMLSDRGRHLTAREIWAFLIDLFFGWTCLQGEDEAGRQDGYFWNRVFDADNSISRAIKQDFDPLQVARARDDSDLWLGRSTNSGPITPPHVSARKSSEDGLRGFSSAKRHHFFFSKTWDIDHTLSSFVPASAFGELLTRAASDQDVAPELSGLINAFRLGVRTQADLWISRHHSFAAHRRPSTLAASGKVSSSQLIVRVPFAEDADFYPESGFFPHRLLLGWACNDQELVIDFDTWRKLQESRNLIVDRSQETLDFALDIFLAQGDPPEARDPEILVFDHRRGQQTTLMLSMHDRRVNVL